MIVKGETSRFVGKVVTVSEPLPASSDNVAKPTYTPALRNTRPARYVKPQQSKKKPTTAPDVPYAPSYNDIGPTKRAMVHTIAQKFNLSLNAATTALHNSKQDNGTWCIERATDMIMGRALTVTNLPVIPHVQSGKRIARIELTGDYATKSGVVDVQSLAPVPVNPRVYKERDCTTIGDKPKTAV